MTDAAGRKAAQTEGARRPSPLVRRLVLAAGLVLPALVAPRCIAGRGAAAWFDGDAQTQDALAQTVARAVLAQRGPLFYDTASERFDGQSAIAIYQMALLGLGQIVVEHPEKRDDYLPAMRRAGERLARPDVLRYAQSVYGHHGVTEMHAGEGHAYLGYINLGLGMLRLVDPKTPLAPVHDRVTAELARRLDASPRGLIETYPGETWPPDVAAVAGSIGLHARATGSDYAALLARWAKRFETCAVHASGLLVQRVRSGTCAPLDAPRGSGTAIGAYFIAFAAPDLAKRLYDGLVAERRVVLGFGGIREYAPGYEGEGDVNAGPILFGLSVGATGFGLGAARIHGDRATFESLYRSAYLLGLPARTSGGATFAAGGVLGDALLLAMLTARVP